MGPSCSGKSTLAESIGRRTGLPVVHLDRLYHVPGSDWQRRFEEEFLAAHAEAIREEAWVIEGNYSRCLPERLQRATGFVLLDSSAAASLFRYVRRTFARSRPGALNGNQDSIKLSMLWHVAVVTPRNRRRYRELFRNLELPKLSLNSLKAVQRCSAEWQLGQMSGKAVGPAA